jgi:hypothetical protein
VTPHEKAAAGLRQRRLICIDLTGALMASRDCFST